MSNNRRRRKVSKSDSVAAVREEDDAVLGKAEATPFFHGLPDELVLKVPRKNDVCPIQQRA